MEPARDTIDLVGEKRRLEAAAEPAKKAPVPRERRMRVPYRHPETGEGGVVVFTSLAMRSAQLQAHALQIAAFVGNQHWDAVHGDAQIYFWRLATCMHQIKNFAELPEGFRMALTEDNMLLGVVEEALAHHQADFRGRHVVEGEEDPFTPRVELVPALDDSRGTRAA